MKWILRDAGKRRPKDLPDHIERRLRFALARFGERVERVVVFLTDLNGPKGGVDKACRILVKVRGCSIAMALAIDTQWKAAVDRATIRIGNKVSRELDRIRQHDGQPAGRLPPKSARHGARA